MCTFHRRQYRQNSSFVELTILVCILWVNLIARQKEDKNKGRNLDMFIRSASVWVWIWREWLWQITMRTGHIRLFCWFLFATSQRRRSCSRRNLQSDHPVFILEQYRTNYSVYGTYMLSRKWKEKAWKTKTYWSNTISEDRQTIEITWTNWARSVWSQNTSKPQTKRTCSLAFSLSSPASLSSRDLDVVDVFLDSWSVPWQKWQ